MTTSIGPIDTRFRTALRRVDEAGRLLKFETPVSLEYEMAGLIRKLQGDKAMFFEHVAGYDMPIAANLLVSAGNCETIFGLDALGIRACMERAITDPIPPVYVDEAPCQEIVITEDIDLGRLLPVLLHAPGDAGRYITSGVVIVRDPQSGVYNASYHRLQLHGGNRTGIQIDVGRHLGVAFEHARQQGRPLDFAVALGPDLSIFYAAAFMGAQMPLDADELSAAGGLRGSALPIVQCKTIDTVVPAECEIVLEGQLHHDELQHEGPFGEFVEHFSEAGMAPVFRVSAVTMRRKPIYYAMNGAALEMTMLRKYVMEASAYKALKAAVPIVQDVEMTAGGLHRFHIVIQVKKSRSQDDGFQRNAMLAAFATLKDLDLAIAVDDDIDIRNPTDVEYALATRFEASEDIILIPGARGHEYIRASKNGIRTKLGLDCTVPFDQKERFARVQFAKIDLNNYRTTTEPATGAVHEVFGEVKAPVGAR